MMPTYTVILLVDGQKVGGQSDATYKQVLDLVHDEHGPDVVFDLRLTRYGYAMKHESYKVFPTDQRETASTLVAYRNQ
ncbi:hypothetical protein SEA_DENNEBES_90 [Streptomyces phage Dennebes]|jgi:hypothetical protein|nr:hypothetical protein SEA_DENNEBES_90 [Streptomyces phage Dennebes]